MTMIRSAAGILLMIAITTVTILTELGIPNYFWLAITIVDYS